LQEKQIEFYESIYNQELELKEKLLVGIQITAAIIITNGSSLVYMLRNLDYHSSEIFKFLFYFFALINLIAIVISSVYVALSYKASEYKTIPRLNEVHDYVQKLNTHNAELDEYNKTYNTTLPLHNIKDKFREYILGLYVDCATYNADANQTRSAHSYSGKTWAFASYIPLFICSLLFIIEDMDAASARKPVDISYPELINKFNMIENNLIRLAENKSEVSECQKTPILPLLQKHRHLLHLDSQEMAIPLRSLNQTEEKKDE